MPKTGVSNSRPFSNLFNVAASRSAQMTTAGHLRLARPKVKPCGARARSSRVPAAHLLITAKKRGRDRRCVGDGPARGRGAAKGGFLASAIARPRYGVNVG